MQKAIFLDRDGVINKKPPEHDYVKSWQEFHLLPDVPEALRLVKDKGFLLIIISNQRGVARGLMTTETVDGIHKRLNSLLENHRTKIDEFYYCPHEHNQCRCRKPSPNMVLRAVKDFNVDLKESWMIGDSETDQQTGINAGVKTRLIPPNGSLLKAVEEIVSL